jgi:hypothetical protein
MSNAVAMVASNSLSVSTRFCSPPFVDGPEVMMGGLVAQPELSVEVERIDHGVQMVDVEIAER